MGRDIEHKHQKALIQWCRYMKVRHPELDLLFAIPNGGGRSLAQGVRLKAEGVLAGVSDLMLPVARHGAHGLWIELKAPDGVVSDKQTEWLEKMKAQGYRAEVCWCWQDARDMLLSYLTE